VDRRARILSLIDETAARGVEVGPSFSPVLPKASGADVTVVDHTDADGLREKYRVHGVDLDAIEEVDAIWKGGSLADVLRDRSPFDFVIASHVVEHLPDPLGFLGDCEELLAPGGVLSLALPDSRYCFDCLRPLTSVGQWVDARVSGRTVHTPGSVLDHTLHAAQRGGIVWDVAAVEPLTMVHTRDHVDEMLARSGVGDDYIDVHAWVFTPASFCYLVDMSRALGYTSFVVEQLHDTVGFEFFVSLRRPLEAVSPEWRQHDFEARLAPMLAISRVEPPSVPARRSRLGVRRRRDARTP
jgi:predicted SAM-dependent methyltransferase